MKRVLLLISAVFLLGCSAERRAQQHLKRAIKLDPKVVSEYSVETIIKLDTVVIRPDTVFMEGSVDSSKLDAKAVAGKLKSGEEVTLIDNDRVKVTTKVVGDSLNTKATVKPQHIYETDTIKVEAEKKVKVPGKAITVVEQKKGFFYKLGIGACILIGLAAGVALIRKAVKL